MINDVDSRSVEFGSICPNVLFLLQKVKSSIECGRFEEIKSDLYKILNIIQNSEIDFNEVRTRDAIRILIDFLDLLYKQHKMNVSNECILDCIILVTKAIKVLSLQNNKYLCVDIIKNNLLEKINIEFLDAEGTIFNKYNTEYNVILCDILLLFTENYMKEMLDAKITQIMLLKLDNYIQVYDRNRVKYLDEPISKIIIILSKIIENYSYSSLEDINSIINILFRCCFLDSTEVFTSLGFAGCSIVRSNQKNLINAIIYNNFVKMIYGTLNNSRHFNAWYGALSIVDLLLKKNDYKNIIVEYIDATKLIKIFYDDPLTFDDNIELILSILSRVICINPSLAAKLDLRYLLNNFEILVNNYSYKNMCSLSLFILSIIKIGNSDFVGEIVKCECIFTLLETLLYSEESYQIFLLDTLMHYCQDIISNNLVNQSNMDFFSKIIVMLGDISNPSEQIKSLIASLKVTLPVF